MVDILEAMSDVVNASFDVQSKLTSFLFDFLPETHGSDVTVMNTNRRYLVSRYFLFDAEVKATTFTRESLPAGRKVVPSMMHCFTLLSE